MTLFLSLLLLAPSLILTCSHSKGTLVFADDEKILFTHSMFLDSITKVDKRVNITFATKPAKEIKFKEYGSFLYDNVVLIIGSLDKMPLGLSVGNLVDFLDQGGNMLLITDSRAGNLVRRLIKECGYEMLPQSVMVVDPVHFDASDIGSRTVLVLDSQKQLIPGSGVFAKRPTSPLLYQGSGFIPIKDNTLVETLIASSETTYPDDLYDRFKSSQSIVHVPKFALVGTIKMRNDARAVLAGSIDFFSNRFFNSYVDHATDVGQKSQLSGNKLASEQLILWTFKMQGVIRVASYNHRAPRLAEIPQEYNVEELIEYTIELQELKYIYSDTDTTTERSVWVPYSASDVQFEFLRIDPFVRQTYNRSRVNGVYTVNFAIPDIIGIFKLQTSYNSPGYNRLSHHVKVIVRPKKHDDFPRFVVPAWPHYTTCIVMMGLTYLLMFLLVNYKEPAVVGSLKSEAEDKKHK